MLFKNHDKNSSAEVLLNDFLAHGQLNSIIYSDPFLKIGFVSSLVHETKNAVLYVDLDLLYSGYVASGAIADYENLVLYQPTEETIEGLLTEIVIRASTSQVLIIIDSINGLFNILNYKKDVGRVVASIMMLLASIIRKTDSTLVIASMARYKKEEGWILSPTGKRLIETKDSKKILLEHEKAGIMAKPINGAGKVFLSADRIQI